MKKILLIDSILFTWLFFSVTTHTDKWRIAEIAPGWTISGSSNGLLIFVTLFNETLLLLVSLYVNIVCWLLLLVFFGDGKKLWAEDGSSTDSKVNFVKLSNFDSMYLLKGLQKKK